MAESAELASHLPSRRTRHYAHGFSLHAAVRCGAGQRQEFERLCRYITRPAIANERLKPTCAGQVVPRLKNAFRDGTTHVVMSPLEFMQRLPALVPRPPSHLVRFHGVLAPQAKLRSAVVPGACAGLQRGRSGLRACPRRTGAVSRRLA